jgi:hypothetical protein
MKVRADQRVGLLLAGVVVLALFSIGATVVLPASDESIKAETVELTAEAEKGADLYREHSLWQCNTAYERETSVDGVGATTPEQVGGQSPVMLGVERLVADPTSAQAVAGSCGVKLSEDDLAAVGAFLASRSAP